MARTINICDEAYEMVERMLVMDDYLPEDEPSPKDPQAHVIEYLIRRHYQRSGAEDYFGPVPPRTEFQ